MKHQQFMVVELPKENQSGNFMLSEPQYFDDYSDAFDAVNEVVSNEGMQIFKQPKGTNPIRIAMDTKDIELWVIARTGELLKK